MRILGYLDLRVQSASRLWQAGTSGGASLRLRRDVEGPADSVLGAAGGVMCWTVGCGVPTAGMARTGS